MLHGMFERTNLSLMYCRAWRCDASVCSLRHDTRPVADVGGAGAGALDHGLIARSVAAEAWRFDGRPSVNDFQTEYGT